MSSGASIAGEPPVAAVPPYKEAGAWRKHALAAGFLAPAAVFLLVWIVYPAINTIYRSFFTFKAGPPQTSHELNGWGDNIVHDYVRGIERRVRHAVPERAVVIDLGVAQVLVGKVLETLRKSSLALEGRGPGRG